MSSRGESPADPEAAQGAGQAGPSSGPSAELAGPTNTRAVRRPRTVRRRSRTSAPRGLDAITGVPGPSSAARDRIWEPPRARDLAFLAAGANNSTPGNGERCL